MVDGIHAIQAVATAAGISLLSALCIFPVFASTKFHQSAGDCLKDAADVLQARAAHFQVRDSRSAVLCYGVLRCAVRCCASDR